MVDGKVKISTSKVTSPTAARPLTTAGSSTALFLSSSEGERKIKEEEYCFFIRRWGPT
jgi:hypothetical protein